MQTQAQRALAYDRYLEVPDMPEWSDSDINEAIDVMEEFILSGGLDWDKDGSYRIDLSIEVERILIHEPKDEQLALIKEARAKRVHDWCVSVVRRDPNFYCNEYCNTEF